MHILRTYILYSTIILMLVTPLTGSTAIQYMQLPSINQNYYEQTLTLNKPNLLQGETGLCGIFATYNGHCMLNALDDPKNAEQHLAQMKSIDAFHQWVKNNEPMLQKIKQQRKSVGNLNNVALQPLTAQLSPNQIERIKAFDYSFIEEKKSSASQESVGIATQIKDQIKSLASTFICKKFAEQFQNSQKPHVVIFNLENHWITSAFNSTETIVADSCGIDRTKDYRVIELNKFMRS